MKLQFDPNQQFQLDAVQAITGLFEGQPQGAPDYSVIDLGQSGGIFGGQEQTELGVGNRLLLPLAKLTANTRAVQLSTTSTPTVQFCRPCGIIATSP